MFIVRTANYDLIKTQLFLFLIRSSHFVRIIIRAKQIHKWEISKKTFLFYKHLCGTKTKYGLKTDYVDICVK